MIYYQQEIDGENKIKVCVEESRALMMSQPCWLQGAAEAKEKRPDLTRVISSSSMTPAKQVTKLRVFHCRCYSCLSLSRTVLSFDPSRGKSIDLVTSLVTVTEKCHCRLFNKSAMVVGTIGVVIDVHHFIHLNWPEEKERERERERITPTDELRSIYIRSTRHWHTMSFHWRFYYLWKAERGTERKTKWCILSIFRDDEHLLENVERRVIAQWSVWHDHFSSERTDASEDPRRKNEK